MKIKTALNYLTALPAVGLLLSAAMAFFNYGRGWAICAYAFGAALIGLAIFKYRYAAVSARIVETDEFIRAESDPNAPDVPKWSAFHPKHLPYGRAKGIE